MGRIVPRRRGLFYVQDIKKPLLLLEKRLTTGIFDFRPWFYFFVFVLAFAAGTASIGFNSCFWKSSGFLSTFFWS